MPSTPNYRGICNQRMHWAQRYAEALTGDDTQSSADAGLRESALLQLQIAYTAHLADLMGLRDAVWQGQRSARDIRLDCPEIAELKALEGNADWMAPLFWLDPATVVSALSRRAESGLLASNAVDYKSIDNNAITVLCAKLDELVQRQRDQLQEY